MSKNQLTKDEFRVRILTLKNKLNDEHIEHDMNIKDLTHKYLNEILDIIDEYRY
jgi:hypothetical protein